MTAVCHHKVDGKAQLKSLNCSGQPCLLSSLTDFLYLGLLWQLLHFPLSFKDAICLSDLAVSQLVTRESRSHKSYSRGKFCLWTKGSVSIHSVSFERAKMKKKKKKKEKSRCSIQLSLTVSAISRWKEISFHPLVCQQRQLNLIQQTSSTGNTSTLSLFITGIALATSKRFSKVIVAWPVITPCIHLFHLKGRVWHLTFISFRSF